MIIKEGEIKTKAWFSDNENYRYRLTRIWDPEKEVVAVIMLNPSHATESKLDQTNMKLCNWLIEKNVGGVEILNMYAFMATNPRHLVNRDEAFERPNDIYISVVAEQVQRIILAWARGGAVERVQRKREVLRTLEPHSDKLFSFSDGELNLRHPVKLTNTWTLVPFEPRFDGLD
jgi:hypothetical protein